MFWVVLFSLLFIFNPVILAEEATGSASTPVPTVITPTLTIAPSLSPSLTPTVILSPIPTTVPTETPTEAPTPTVTPTATLTPTPTAKPTLIPTKILTPTPTEAPIIEPTQVPEIAPMTLVPKPAVTSIPDNSKQTESKNYLPIIFIVLGFTMFISPILIPKISAKIKLKKTEVPPDFPSKNEF